MSSPIVEPAFYRPVLPAMTFGSIRRHVPSLPSALFKFFLLRSGILNPVLKTTMAFWLPEDLDTLLAEERDISRVSHDALRPVVAAFEESGFQIGCWVKNRKHLTPYNLDSGGVMLLHPEGRAVASVSWIRLKSHVDEAIAERTGVSLYSRLNSDRRIGVTNNAQHMDPVDTDKVVFVDSSDPGVLSAALDKELASHEAAGESPVPVRDYEALRTDYNRHSARSLEFYLRRGRFVRATDAEIQQLNNLYVLREGTG